MSKDNNTTDGSSEETTILNESKVSNVIDFKQFKKNKEEGVIPSSNEKQWPAAVVKDTQIPITVSAEDPNQRRILLSLAHGDIIVDGHLGLSQTFLAVGDAQGRIKFAAAPGMWLYARDCTDDVIEPPTAA